MKKKRKERAGKRVGRKENLHSSEKCSLPLAETPMPARSERETKYYGVARTSVDLNGIILSARRGGTRHV